MVARTEAQVASARYPRGSKRFHLGASLREGQRLLLLRGRDRHVVRPPALAAMTYPQVGLRFLARQQQSGRREWHDTGMGPHHHRFLSPQPESADQPQCGVHMVVEGAHLGIQRVDVDARARPGLGALRDARALVIGPVQP